MSIQTVLYYRYLSYQTFILFLIYFFLALLLCLLFLFSNLLSIPYSYIVSGIVWIVPFLSVISWLIWLIKYLKYKKEFNDDTFVSRFKNSVLRDKVLKAGIRMKYIFPKKNQEQNFIQAIQIEIDKQKKLFSLLNEKNGK